MYECHSHTLSRRGIASAYVSLFIPNQLLVSWRSEEANADIDICYLTANDHSGDVADSWLIFNLLVGLRFYLIYEQDDLSIKCPSCLIYEFRVWASPSEYV